MSFNELMFLILIVYGLAKFMNWFDSRQSKDLDFNLNDPERMTGDQRRAEIRKCIDRANILCKVDDISGEYMRINEETYKRFVLMERSRKQ